MRRGDFVMFLGLMVLNSDVVVLIAPPLFYYFLVLLLSCLRDEVR